MHKSECIKLMSVYKAHVGAVSAETSAWIVQCPHNTTYVGVKCVFIC